MKGDFSRLTFNYERHYSAVLMQQGRVQVDADWNEQQALTRYRAETEAADVIGRCGGPQDNAAFGVVRDPTKLPPADFQKFHDWCKVHGKKADDPLNGDFVLTGGRYYADGILCESETPLLFTLQPDYTQKALAKEGSYAIYLDVWHRHITALDDDHIHEKALSCPDTTSRAKVVWQVKAMPLSDLKLPSDATDPQTSTNTQNPPSKEAIKIFIKSPPVDDAGSTTTDSPAAPTCEDVCNALRAKLTSGMQGALAARTRPAPQMDTPCQLPPSAGYQRLENQLYRVEIHHGGTFQSGSNESKITFKWSRDNGTVVTAITDLAADKNGATITVRDTGPDDVLGFATGQWVEVIDDWTELNGVAGDLLQITGVTEKTITATGDSKVKFDKTLHPKLRRWDQTSTVTLANGVAINGDWQSLEDGVQVRFSEGVYKTGDYWLIPGRTATADIEWPQVLDNLLKSQPQATPAFGIKHHYCCLAIVNLTAKKVVTTKRYTGPIPTILDAEVTDCRCLFPTLCQLHEAAAELKPCVKVTKINYGGDYAFPLVNGATIGFEQLLIGIQLTCDHGVDRGTISRATAFIVVELPYPAVLIGAIAPIKALLATAESFSFGGGKSLPTVSSLPTLGYQPLVLAGNPAVDDSKTNLITWVPVSSDLDQLKAFLSFFVKSKPILARLTLKGNFIWSDKDSSRYLDGEAFGTTNSTMASGIQLPSGEGRRGGDFEMWFYVGLEDSRGDLMVFQTKTSAMEKYIVNKYQVLKHDFSASVSKSAFIQKYGSDALSDGGTVADALNILSGNPSFASVEAIPDALAKTEAKSLQANIGSGKILNDSFGTTNISGNIGDVEIENMTAIPDSVRNNLSDLGISTVADLASAAPTVLKQTSSSLSANGVNVTLADLAGYAGLAKILVKLP